MECLAAAAIIDSASGIREEERLLKALAAHRHFAEHERACTRQASLHKPEAAPSCREEVEGRTTQVVELGKKKIALRVPVYRSASLPRRISLLAKAASVFTCRRSDPL